jgi:hypothetical protein
MLDFEPAATKVLCEASTQSRASTSSTASPTAANSLTVGGSGKKGDGAACL